ATSQKSRCTSNPIDLPITFTSTSFNDLQSGENWRANDTDRYVLAAQLGQSQGRPLTMPGLEAHRPKRPAQPAFSPRAPVPVTRPYRPESEQGSRESFSCPDEQSCQRTVGARSHTA